MIYNMDRLDDLYKAVKRLATQFLPAECEDLTQEIALKLWSKRTRIPANFNSKYLQSIVRNAACDMVRKERKRKQLCYLSLNNNGSISVVGEPKQQFYVIQGGVDAASESQNVLENCFAAIDRLAKTYAALEKLSQEQRSIVELAADGYSYSEIAAQQGIAVGTVRSRLHYARKKMKELSNESN